MLVRNIFIFLVLPTAVLSACNRPDIRGYMVSSYQAILFYISIYRYIFAFRTVEYFAAAEDIGNQVVNAFATVLNIVVLESVTIARIAIVMLAMQILIGLSPIGMFYL